MSFNTSKESELYFKGNRSQKIISYGGNIAHFLLLSPFFLYWPFYFRRITDYIRDQTLERKMAGLLRSFLGSLFSRFIRQMQLMPELGYWRWGFGIYSTGLWI